MRLARLAAQTYVVAVCLAQGGCVQPTWSGGHAQFGSTDYRGSLVRVTSASDSARAELLYADETHLVLAAVETRTGFELSRDMLRRVEVRGPFVAGIVAAPYFSSLLAVSHGYLMLVSGPALAVGMVATLIENRGYRWLRIDFSSAHHFARFPVMPEGWTLIPTQELPPQRELAR